MPTTTGMKGGGFYDANSGPQRAAIDAFIPWLEAAIHDLQLATDAPIRVLDVGSSEGSNAIYVMKRLVAVLRKRSSAPISVAFSDLPTNDFNQLFSNLRPHGRPAFSASNIFPSAIGGSGFGRLVPANSLQVATTFNAIGFLETKPKEPLLNCIQPMGPSPTAPREGVSVTDEEQKPFREQAAEDLHRFYLSRAEELIPGGKLLVQVFGRDSQHSTSNGIYDALSDALLDCIEDNLLPRSVYEQLVIPVYQRNADELIEPILSDDKLKRSFRLENVGSQEAPAPFNQRLAETGDVKEWAKSYVGFFRAFTEAIVSTVLPTDQPVSILLDTIYRRAEERLIADPARYEFHFVSVATLLTRI